MLQSPVNVNFKTEKSNESCKLEAQNLFYTIFKTSDSCSEVLIGKEQDNSVRLIISMINVYGKQ